MSRTITSTQLAAQQLGTTPYLELVFTSRDGGTTYDYSFPTSQTRTRVVEHHEEPYDVYANIMLDNSDLAVPDLRGYWVKIGYGNVTGSGNEHVHTSRMWVKNQYIVSMEGQLRVVLQLKGIWTVMEEQLVLIGDPPLYKVDYSTDTIYEVIDILITELATATGIALTLAALATSDGVMDSFNPALEINAVPYESFARVIQFLLEMTSSYIRFQETDEFEIIYPQVTDPADETYYSDSASGYFFFEYTEVRNLSIPNHIIVYANYDEGGYIGGIPVVGEWYDSEEFTGTTYSGRYMEVRGLYPAPSITNVTDATNRASAIAAKALAEIVSGRLVVPHDARVELYDRVAIYDNRGT